jgi:hypothetical protein
MKYFLDTTALVELHAGDRQRRDAVADRLGRDEHASSAHVLREWRHIVEGAAIDVLNAIGDGASELRDVWARLSQGYGRAQGQRMRTLAMLSGQSLDVDSLAIRAEMFLRSGADVLFRNSVGVLRDGSQCGLAREPVTVEPSGRRKLKTTCKRGECVCDQPNFLAGEEARVAAATTALRQHDEYRTAARRAAEAMNNPNLLARTGKNCWGPGGLGGDISIALECARDETILTTDKSFDVIGPAVGVAVERISPTPPP